MPSGHGWLGDSLKVKVKVKVKAPSEKGRTNEAVVALLTERLGIDASSIAVVNGHSSPAKVVAIDRIDDHAFPAAFPREKSYSSSVVRHASLDTPVYAGTHILSFQLSSQCPIN